MTLEEMILLYRAQADDKAEPYLADDELLTLYANEGQTEACRRAELLRDSASPMCVLNAAPGDEVIAVDARIVRILRAKVNGRDVGIVSGEHMDAMAPNWQDDGATGTPTHLIAINQNRQVSILELPGGDASKLQVLAGPYLVGADGDTVVPYLSFNDLTQDGNVDLLLQVRGEVVVYVNDQGKFRLLTPAERAQLVAPGARGP